MVRSRYCGHGQDGEAVVVGPDGLSRFEELSHREAARTAILYAFDLIEYDGEDQRDLPFLDCKAALAQLLRNTEAGIRFNEHIAVDGQSSHACQLGLTEGPDLEAFTEPRKRHRI
jgi:ATP-dependent DNA ligase